MAIEYFIFFTSVGLGGLVFYFYDKFIFSKTLEQHQSARKIEDSDISDKRESSVSPSELSEVELIEAQIEKLKTLNRNTDETQLAYLRSVSDSNIEHFRAIQRALSIRPTRTMVDEIEAHPESKSSGDSKEAEV